MDGNTSTKVDTPRPELLAPAGDFDALRAAVANGADAVYFGLSQFNARYRATNFTLEQLPETMAYLHERGVKGYVTLNTLIFSDELPQLVDYVTAVAQAGVDAVIVQDLGLARLIHRLVPELAIHGSTQMTLTEARGIEWVRRLGIERVILARELSLPEIQRITGQTSLPVEVFVHGALCVAYSGQCLTSESFGGRSANRGQCAQACRQPYQLLVDGQLRDLGDKAYLLSPQDLAAYDLIDELTQAGVCSFKIEGRLKSAHYVAATTQTYRAAIDAAVQHQPFVLAPAQQRDLAQSFSRGFTHGFLQGVNHQELVQGRFPKSRGVKLGTVVEIGERDVVITLDAAHLSAVAAPREDSPRPGRNASAAGSSRRDLPSAAVAAPARSSISASTSHSTSSAAMLEEPPLPVKPGDGIVFDEGHPEQDEQGGRVFSVNRQPGRTGEVRVRLGFGHGAVNTRALTPGCTVWKTDDPELRKRLERTFASDEVPRRIPLRVTAQGQPGERLVLTFTAAGQPPVSVEWDQPLARAHTRPLVVETLREQLGRLGQTSYELEQVECIDSQQQVVSELPVMVPKSVLNDLRRQGVERLVQARRALPRIRNWHAAALTELRDDIARLYPPRPRQPHALSVLVRTEEQCQAVIEICTTTAKSAADLSRDPAAHPSADAPSAEGGAAGGAERVAGEGLAGSRAKHIRPQLVYCDFEDVRRSGPAIEKLRAAGLTAALATPRVIKPGEEGLLQQVIRCRPDAVLVRNLSALSFFREQAPHLQLFGDYSLNVANELTASLFLEAGLARIVPGYDLNLQQLSALLARIDPTRFEVVLHQHIPMFHMEHCVFSHTLSNGKDFHDCGRPCDRHRVELRDHVGEAHPLVADVGCRNTVFNAHAQSGARFVPQLSAWGVHQFRVELLRETASETRELLDSYARVLAGESTGPRVWRELQVLTQLGVTPGTLEFE